MTNRLFILTFLFFLVGCTNQYLCLKLKNSLDVFINRYYEINYEYPLSIEDLLLFCENDSSFTNNLQDSIVLDYIYLKNHTKQINWIINESSFLCQELTVLHDQDTLIHRINDWRFPCIGYYNDAYVNCYLKEPESLDIFLSFCHYCDSVEDNTNELYNNCYKTTIKNLQKCKQIGLFQWIKEEDRLLFMIGNDTVWFHNASNPCNNGLIWLFQPHYYNKSGQYIKLGEVADRKFNNIMKELWDFYYGLTKPEKMARHIFVYSDTGEIKPLCEGVNLDTDNNYFEDLVGNLNEFADEYSLSRIVFVAIVYEKG